MSDADAGVGNVHRSVPSAPQAQRAVSVGQVARRLGYAANSTAQALYSITNMQDPLPETQSMRLLVQKLYALATALSDLKANLVESGEHEVWTEEHGESLLCSLNESEDVIRAVVRAVREADKASNALPRPPSGGDYSRVHILADGFKAEEIVDRCYELVVQTGLVARYEVLARKDYLDENEVSEALRLVRAFDGSVLGSIQAFKDGLRDSEQLQEYLVPSLITPASSADHTKSEPGPMPSIPPIAMIEESKPKESVPVSAYNQWPPFGNLQYPAYLAAVAKQTKEDSKPTVTEYLASLESTLKALSGSGPSTGQHSTSGLTPQSQTGSISFGEPSTIKPTFNGSSLFGKGPFGSYSKHDRSNANPFAPTSRLEAYILRPTMQSTSTSNTLCYGIEPLQVNGEAMEGQIRSSGPDYSVMDSLLDLQPQQLHLLQTHARQRQGSIVHVQQGKPADLCTLLGALQASPVMFIIQTTTVLEQNPFKALDPIPVVPDTTPTASRDQFGGHAPATGFKMPNTGSFYSSIHHLSSPEAFSQRLSEQGEPCTYVEGTERKGAFQHYQTITTNTQWHKNDRSLEEIRLADYNAGRKGPMKTTGVSYPWDGTKNLFGGLISTPSTEVNAPETGRASSNPFPPTAGFPFRTNEPKKSLFDQPVPNSLSVPLPHASGNAGSSHGTFSHVVPHLPSFAPPKVPGIFTSSPGTGLFTHNALGSNACVLQGILPSSSSSRVDIPSTPPLFENPFLGSSAAKHSFAYSTEPRENSATQHRPRLFDRVPQPPSVPLGSLSGHDSKAVNPFGTPSGNLHPDQGTRATTEFMSPKNTHLGASTSTPSPSSDSAFNTALASPAPTITDSFGPPAVAPASRYSLFGPHGGASKDGVLGAKPDS